MGDYFAAVAARALQPEKGVQPRRRVLFEEGSPAVAAVLPAAAALAGRPADVLVNRATAALRPEPAAAGDAKKPETAERTPRRGGSLEKRPADAAAGHAKVALQRRSVRVAEPLPAVPEPHQVDRRRSTTRLAAAGPATEPAPSLSRPRPIDRAAVVAARGGRRGGARPDDAPAIRIHIGRVDVRAVTAAAPKEPARRDAKGPLMTLEDYLKRRIEGQS